VNGQREPDEKIELKRLYYNVIDVVLNEMNARFSDWNSDVICSLSALKPENKDVFLIPAKIAPLIHLCGIPVVKEEFAVARSFLLKQLTVPSSLCQHENWTAEKILKEFCGSLGAMPGVAAAFKIAATFGASAATCERSFSALKNTFSDHRQTMLHNRKANLIQLAFEKDLTNKFKDDWKDCFLKRFHSMSRRLQLFKVKL